MCEVEKSAYSTYTPQEVCELDPIVISSYNAVLYAGGIPAWERVYQQLQGVKVREKYIWNFEKIIDITLVNLRRLLFEIPLEEVPLYINDPYLSQVAAWRLKCAK